MKKLLFLIIGLFLFVNTSFANSVLVENVFSDIDADYQYRDELQSLYDRGTIVADESGLFSPDSLLRRDEFVGISMEVICEKCIQPQTEYRFIEKYFNEDVYFDVTNTNPYFYCIAEADEQNYVRGYDIGQSCEDGSSSFGERPFCPDNNINLEEAIAVLLRNSGIFTIDDNALVVDNIRNGNITTTLGNDVLPSDDAGNPYTFYGYLQKALEYEITEFDSQGNSKTLKLLELDNNGNVGPKKSLTKQEFLKMSYIALKSNSCSDIDSENLALRIQILDKICEQGDTDCELSDLDDPEDTYDFESEVEGVCEGGVDDPTGYIWRFQNLATGEQKISYGSYVDNYLLSSPGEWRIYLRVTDTCGNSSEVYSTIFVSENPDTSSDTIDVDIDIYDDECSATSDCEEIDFYSEDPDEDDIFDFEGEVETSCSSGVITYNWTFNHEETGNTYTYSGRYIDDVNLGFSGTWNIFLQVRDGCDNTGQETLVYIVPEIDDVTQEYEDYIDIDIDVYDDDCDISSGCEEKEFESQEDDGDDIFDFHETIITTCSTAGFTYLWNFSRQGSAESYAFTSAYVDDFSFLNSGVWEISLLVSDACGQTAQEEMIYIISDTSGEALNVSIGADPITGFEDLDVGFEAIISGGSGPYTYEWDFGDGEESFSEEVNHLYDNDGTFSVLLIVTDSRGVTGTATVVIVVLDRDSCEQDSDGDGVVDCDDFCPLVSGDPSNGGCPIFERLCSVTCGCESGYTCSDSDPLTCGAGICVPDFQPETTCLYTPEIGGIYGNAVCTSCPCNNSIDFLADVRRCDLVFPAITSPDASEIYSRGNVWQVQ